MERIIKTIRFPKNLMDEINSISSEKKINFTKFITTAVKSYIDSLKFTDAVRESAGVWEIKGHPELEEGTEAYIREIRKGRKTDGSL